MRTAVVILLLTAILALGCAQGEGASKRNLETPAARSREAKLGPAVFEQIGGAPVPTVLVPSSALESYTFKPISWAKPLWNPSEEQTAFAARLVPSLLAKRRPESREVISPTNARYLSQLRTELSNSVCQAVGVTVGHEQGIWLNFLPGDSSLTSDWTSHFIEVYDGGPRYWSVVYFPTRGEFDRLRIDKGF
jgi:hypothetical protein